MASVYICIKREGLLIYGVLLDLVRARREVGMSSRNVVSRTFPQFFNSRLTPVQCQRRMMLIKGIEKMRTAGLRMV